MHPALSYFPSLEFYNGNLENASTININQFKIPKFPWPDINQPLCFIHTDANETSSGTSYINEFQVDIVCNIINILLKGGLSTNDICILQPYKALVILMRKNN
jgi:superfamily I DNA and/or RNA helicase